MDINKKDHISNLLGSLNRFFVNAKAKGVIRNKELYLLNTVYSLLHKCDTLTTTEEKKLTKLYYQLLNKFPNLLCKTVTAPSKYIFATKKDSHTYTTDDAPIKVSKIYYWQEEVPTTEYADIIYEIENNDYLVDKPVATKTEFEFGIEVPLEHIGRIAFAFVPGDATTELEIRDILGNDISHAFTRHEILSMNIILFVSEYVHSYGAQQIAIIEEQSGVFANEYDDIFE